MPIPYLPNELVDQILSYECLKEEDLVKTCLVSKGWLEPSRKSLYIFVKFGFVSIDKIDGNPFSSDPETSYRYERKSWRLFLTLNNNTNLASSVRIVYFELSPSPCGQDLSINSTRPNDAVSTILRLLPRATAFEFASTDWLVPQRMAAFWPDLYRIQRLTIDKCNSQDWCKTISKLANLRSLEFFGFSKVDSVDGTGLLVSNLEELTIDRCSLQAFQALSIGSESSFRKLRIPLNVLSACDFTLYPNLTTLSLYDCPGVQLLSSCREALHSLQLSTSLRTITLSHDAVTLLNSERSLRERLPSSLMRINLLGWPNLVSILAAIEKTEGGIRIAQLGLPRFIKRELAHEEEEDDQNGLLLIGIRSILQKAKVELVWSWEEVIW